MVIICAERYRELYEAVDSDQLKPHHSEAAKRIVNNLFELGLCDSGAEFVELTEGTVGLMVYCLNVSHPYIDVEFEE